MSDHHDFGDHHYDDHHDEPVPFDDHLHDTPYQPDDHYQWADEHDHAIYEEHADPPPTDDHHDHTPEPEPEPAHTTAGEHDTLPETPDDPAAVFPPALELGALPEPVDGFPWIDTGSLGLADPGTLHALTTAAPLEPVNPHDLAEYAATELPPTTDPWAALADSDDPATSALARWWQQN